VPFLTPKQIDEVAAAAVMTPYEEPGDQFAIEMGMLPSEFYGRPLIEVMLIRQARHAAHTGDKDYVEAILDRRLGRPKTTIESHSIHETYAQALERIGQTEIQKRFENAEPVEVIPSMDELWNQL